MEYVNCADFSVNSVAPRGLCECVCVCVCLSVNCADLATKSYTPTLLHLVTKDNSVFFQVFFWPLVTKDNNLGSRFMHICAPKVFRMCS